MEPFDKLPDVPQQEKKESQTMTSGQWLWKTAKPIGCIVILLMMVMFLIICFTAKPAEDLTGPQAQQTENFAVDKIGTLA